MLLKGNMCTAAFSVFSYKAVGVEVLDSFLGLARFPELLWDLVMHTF